MQKHSPSSNMSLPRFTDEGLMNKETALAFCSANFNITILNMVKKVAL